MQEFKTFLSILETEVEAQRKLLDLLTRERAAVVRMNQKELDRLTAEKESLLSKLQQTEAERKSTALSLSGNARAQRLSDIAARCPARDIRSKLEKTGKLLKDLAMQVRSFGSHNQILLRQALGILSSTISVIRSASGTAVPTYEAGGKIREDSKSLISRRGTSFASEA